MYVTPARQRRHLVQQPARDRGGAVAHATGAGDIRMRKRAVSQRHLSHIIPQRTTDVGMHLASARADACLDMPLSASMPHC